MHEQGMRQVGRRQEEDDVGRGTEAQPYDAIEAGRIREGPRPGAHRHIKQNQQMQTQAQTQAQNTNNIADKRPGQRGKVGWVVGVVAHRHNTYILLYIQTHIPTYIPTYGGNTGRRARHASFPVCQVPLRRRRDGPGKLIRREAKGNGILRPACLFWSCSSWSFFLLLLLLRPQSPSPTCQICTSRPAFLSSLACLPQEGLGGNGGACYLSAWSRGKGRGRGMDLPCSVGILYGGRGEKGSLGCCQCSFNGRKDSGGFWWDEPADIMLVVVAGERWEGSCDWR